MTGTSKTPPLFDVTPNVMTYLYINSRWRHVALCQAPRVNKMATLFAFSPPHLTLTPLLSEKVELFDEASIEMTSQFTLKTENLCDKIWR